LIIWTYMIMNYTACEFYYMIKYSHVRIYSCKEVHFALVKFSVSIYVLIDYGKLVSIDRFCSQEAFWKWCCEAWGLVDYLQTLVLLSSHSSESFLMLLECYVCLYLVSQHRFSAFLLYTGTQIMIQKMYQKHLKELYKNCNLTT